MMRVLASQRDGYEQIQRELEQPAMAVRVSAAVTHEDDFPEEFEEFAVVIRYSVRILGHLASLLVCLTSPSQPAFLNRLLTDFF